MEKIKQGISRQISLLKVQKYTTRRKEGKNIGFDWEEEKKNWNHNSSVRRHRSSREENRSNEAVFVDTTIEPVRTSSKWRETVDDKDTTTKKSNNPFFDLDMSTDTSVSPTSSQTGSSSATTWNNDFLSPTSPTTSVPSITARDVDLVFGDLSATTSPYSQSSSGFGSEYYPRGTLYNTGTYASSNPNLPNLSPKKSPQLGRNPPVRSSTYHSRTAYTPPSKSPSTLSTASDGKKGWLKRIKSTVTHNESGRDDDGFDQDGEKQVYVRSSEAYNRLDRVPTVSR